MDNTTHNIRNNRRPKGIVTPTTTNFLHLKNPWVTAWWSAAFPGFGHILLCNNVKGLLLMLWEILINVRSRLNLAIIYTFTGRFDMAKAILDRRWLLLYVGVFVYGIWDSYRGTIDLNKLSVLAYREKSLFFPVKISGMEINYLDKKSPWVSVAWSMFMPGLGHLYIHRLITGFVILAWTITIAYLSHVLEAIHFTAVGDFVQAIKVTNPQWLLFLPSIYCFSIYDSYVNTVEYNKLFEIEQGSFLKENYQDCEFEMPV